MCDFLYATYHTHTLDVRHHNMSDLLDTLTRHALWRISQMYTSVLSLMIIASSITYRFDTRSHADGVTDDHLDYYTIVDLWKHHESTIHFFVPFGLKAWFTSSGIPGDRVTELDWWHEVILNFASPSQTPFEQSEQSGSSEDTEMAVDANAALTLKVVFTPAQHRSGRGVFDQMKTLWGSWCVGVVEADDRQKAMRQGMKEWSGFKLFFGG